ncbi:hypothetical protein DPMN_137433 [Dreissena polymorpha]|uniref:Uncharacterized protein n=1 Tax=Dreissena polymorpha TaxID=45954 RepID=A0A9D4G5R6_DREPO|nr:hypothetical protein DPMN_137433 [Dreissena polymorpha]
MGDKVLDKESLFAAKLDHNMDISSYSGKLLESPQSSVSAESMKEKPVANPARLYQGGVGRGLLLIVCLTSGKPISLEALSLVQGGKTV